MNKAAQTLAPGARVVVRDAEWLMRKVDRTSTGGLALTVVGISELVRHKAALFMGEKKSPAGGEAEARTRSLPPLFSSDFAYLQAAIGHLRQSQPLQAEFTPGEQRADLTPTEELEQRFHSLPREIWPEDGAFTLSVRQEVSQEEIKRSRKDKTAWPRIHYLWPLNPIMEWVNDRVLAAFGRREAPVIILPGALAAGESIFVLSGLIPICGKAKSESRPGGTERMPGGDLETLQ